MKIQFKLFFILILLVMSSCERYSTYEAGIMYKENKAEFDQIFKMFSEQKRIRLVSGSFQPFEKGFKRFSLTLLPQDNKEGHPSIGTIELNPKYALTGDVEFDQSEIKLINSYGLDEIEVTEYCNFVDKYDLYDIDILGVIDSFKIVRLSLNPYQDYYYIPDGVEPEIPNVKEVVRLDSNVYFLNNM